MFAKEDDGLLTLIVRGDETWVSYITPESKQQLIVWRHTTSLEKKKFKQTMSTRKITCTVFWDRLRVLFVEFLSITETVNKDIRCAKLLNLRRAIQNERSGMLSRGIPLILDNFRPYTANKTQDLVASFGWEQFDHLPYSPDLTQRDFRLLLHLKKFLQEVQTWLSS